jgi:hypothetical protein
VFLSPHPRGKVLRFWEGRLSLARDWVAGSFGNYCHHNPLDQRTWYLSGSAQIGVGMVRVIKHGPSCATQLQLIWEVT